MIRPSEIARLAHRLRLGDKTIEKDYVLTWLLLAIADSPLCDRLAFKGGTAIKKVYQPEYRFSEDLDFTVLDEISNETLIAETEAMFPWLLREVRITMAVRRSETHQTGSLALYLNYIGPLRGDLSSRFVKADFTRDEVLLFPLVKAQLQTPYSDCQGRIETLNTYSPEEILSDKLCALLGRTEPRDLYDVYYLLAYNLADAEAVSFRLAERLAEKMASKGLDPTALADVLARKQSTFARLWEPRLRGQISELPHLDRVIRETNRWFRRIGLV